MASQSDLKTSRKGDSETHLAEAQRNEPAKTKQDLLKPEEAEAAGPEGTAACGEEDPGAALELLVDDEEDKEKK